MNGISTAGMTDVLKNPSRMAVRQRSSPRSPTSGLYARVQSSTVSPPTTSRSPSVTVVGCEGLVAAIDDAIRRIKACGNAPGILTGDEALARHFIEQGCLFTAVGADVSILVQGSERLAARFKA